MWSSVDSNIALYMAAPGKRSSMMSLWKPVEPESVEALILPAGQTPFQCANVQMLALILKEGLRSEISFIFYNRSRRT